MIRKVTENDAEAIAGIYNYYVEKTIITFETKPVSVAGMRERITTLSSHGPYFVCEQDDRGVVGYCYAAPWKQRSAYRSTLESTVYVAPGYRNKGVGRALVLQLIEALKQTPTHALIACIAIPNPESIRLHESLGFERASHFREFGWKLDVWVDVGDWELLL